MDKINNLSYNSHEFTNDHHNIIHLNLLTRQFDSGFGGRSTSTKHEFSVPIEKVINFNIFVSHKTIPFRQKKKLYKSDLLYRNCNMSHYFVRNINL